MWEGHSLLTVLETQHYVIANRLMSMAEFHSMVPWQLELELAFIRTDREKKLDQIKRSGSLV